jgi:uncharacterized protein YdeI (YjbR/CyaY-like superfamily)
MPTRTPAPKKTHARPATRPKAEGNGALPAELPVKGFADVGAWAAWLTENHASSPGVWLKIAKKDSQRRSVTYAEALEQALVWGWIDGQKRAMDETAWLQRFTPRSTRSPWSLINREKALALIASGAMKPPGLIEVERAKKDGRWELAYASQSKATVPPDLAAALAASPRAAQFFETLESYNRYAVLHRIHGAKKPETRAARIAKFVEMLERGERIHPPRPQRAEKGGGGATR